MDEYIKREAALSAVDCGNLHKGIVDALQENIKAIPAADVVEVRHGRWEAVMLDHERMGCRPTAHYCSECNQITWFRTFYCPNCGAKMDGGVNNAAD